MSSPQLGKDTSDAEVTNISRHGIWVLVGEKEYLLPYEKYPWFKDARLGQVLGVELLHGFHLYWPELDVDLDVASLENPDRLPLVYRGE